MTTPLYTKPILEYAYFHYRKLRARDLQPPRTSLQSKFTAFFPPSLSKYSSIHGQWTMAHVQELPSPLFLSPEPKAANHI